MAKTRSSTLVFALAYIAFVAGVFFALGGAAYAAEENPSSASDQYNVVKDVVVNAPADPTDTGTAVADVAQALPNTGLSLLATAVIGGALIALGVALRRREHRRKS
jgi:LPXTG-motif cell wall-anchored protein